MYSPTFADRLREAREARGWSLAQLADMVGKSKQAIAQFELRQSTPSPDLYLALIRALRVPPSFFEREPLKPDLNPIFFRKLKSARDRDVLMASRRLTWLQHTIDCMERYVEFPAVCLPDVLLKSDPKDITVEDIEGAAAQVRRFWQLGQGAISSVVRLLENQGCIVVRDGLDVPAIDAFSQWQYKKHRPIVALSREDEGVFFREQASAAHELGHLLLHRNIDKRFTARECSEHDLIESQANRFAGAFLLPPAAFKQSVRATTLDAFYLLKMQWLVSIGLMIYRSKDLGLIDSEGATKLWKLRTKRGWNRVEPLDPTTPREQPQMLTQGIEAIRGAGHLLQWLNEVSLSTADIAQFASADESLVAIPAAAPRLRALHTNRPEHE
jgi:Zn-dependent peptidase ImmA (M78 family)/DNA-binding XRE family transcriptional regulator